MKLVNGITRVSFRREDFRISFRQPFLMIFAASLILTECIFTLTGNNSGQIVYVVLPTLVTLMCAAAVLVLKFRVTYQLSPDGISCSDLWKRPHYVAWDNVIDIDFVQTIGLRYLKVVVRGTDRSIWLPLFVTRSATLQNLLTHYLNNSSVHPNRIERFWS